MLQDKNTNLQLIIFYIFQVGKTEVIRAGYRKREKEKGVFFIFSHSWSRTLIISSSGERIDTFLR